MAPDFFLAERFDSPVGTLEERAGPDIPGGDWYCPNAFGAYYKLGATPDGMPIMAFHTGADLVLWPGGGAHQPIYAVANGEVTFAARIAGSWGNVIVVEHTLPDGKLVYSRYGHVEAVQVAVGDPVRRGQQIAAEGNAFGRFPYHLHFDISLTGRLRRDASDWPGLDMERLRRHYVDPLRYIKEHRNMTEITVVQLQALRTKAQGVVEAVDTLVAQLQPPAPPPPAPPPPGQTMYAVVEGLHIRLGPSTGAQIVGELHRGDAVVVTQMSGSWATITLPRSGYVYAPSLSATRPN